MVSEVQGDRIMREWQDMSYEDWRKYYAEKYQKNYDNYQDTGDQKYYREYAKCEAIVDAFNLAIASSDDHKEIGAIRGALCNLADLCEQAIYSNDTKKLKDACKQIVSTAELSAGYKRRMTK